jgi:hypothetical protein
MDTQVQNTILELGTFSIVVPAVWAVAALIGFVTLANWPEMFAVPAAATVQLSAQAGPAPAAQSPIPEPSAP